MKYKHFIGDFHEYQRERSVLALNKQVNDWLEEHKDIKILHIAQSESVDANEWINRVNLSIFYYE